MSRGRQSNVPRNEARAAGLKTYDDPARGCWCGCDTRYVSNAQCIDCAIAKGRARYAALDLDGLAAVKAKDHERYLKRLARGADE